MMEGIYALMNTVLPLDALQFNFMKNAFLAILLLTPLLGLLGTMAVQQQMAFFSDALGHSALTGIGLGIVLGMHDDLLSMLIFGVVWAIAISRIKQTGTTSADTIISVFSSTSIALGLVILAHGGGFAKYSTLLIGDVLAVTPQDLLYLLIDGVRRGAVGGDVQCAAADGHQCVAGAEPWDSDEADGVCVCGAAGGGSDAGHSLGGCDAD